MRDFMLFPFLATYAEWSSWDTWCSGSFLLLLLQICRGAFILRLLLLLLLLLLRLLLLLLLLRLLLLRLSLLMALLLLLAAPAPAVVNGITIPDMVRPYGCHWYKANSSCP